MRYSAAEMARLRPGYRPQSDDDKWAIRFVGDDAIVERASDARMLFIVAFQSAGDGWRGRLAWVSPELAGEIEVTEEFAGRLFGWHFFGRTPG